MAASIDEKRRDVQAAFDAAYRVGCRSYFAA
jgi:hypothetical protein